MDFEVFKEKLFDRAKAEGLTEFEIYYTEGSSFKVGVYEKEIDNYSVNSSRGLGFRGLWEGKMGYSYTEVLDDEAVLMLVKSAKDNACLIESEDMEVIFEGSGNYTDLDGFTGKLSEMSAESKIRLALEMEKEAIGFDSRVARVQHCSVQYFEGSTVIVNSKGLDKSYKSNGMSAVLVPVINDNGKMKTAVAFRITKDINGVVPCDIAKEAVEDGLSYLGAQSIKSGKYKIAIKNDAASDLLGTFSGIFDAERVHKGLSLLKDKIGKEIGSKSITIIDDPLLKDAPCSSPFDAEGAACFTKEIVAGGRLNTFLHNLKTAHKDGIETTGNASKSSYASPIGISPSNFYIKPGDKSYDQILDALGDGLLITDLQGLHSGANTVSGDFSLAAKGYLIKDGKVERPVEQITVAGNFYKLLFDIEEVANDLRFGIPSSGCFGSPTILVSQLSVAGE